MRRGKVLLYFDCYDAISIIGNILGRYDKALGSLITIHPLVDLYALLF